MCWETWTVHCCTCFFFFKKLVDFRQFLRTHGLKTDTVPFSALSCRSLGSSSQTQLPVITLLLSSIHRTLLNNFSLSFHVVVGSKPIHQSITQLVKNCFVTCCVKSSAWFSFPATLCTFEDVLLWHLLCQHSLCFKMFCSFSGSKSL